VLQSKVHVTLRIRAARDMKCKVRRWVRGRQLWMSVFVALGTRKTARFRRARRGRVDNEL